MYKTESECNVRDGGIAHNGILHVHHPHDLLFNPLSPKSDKHQFSP